MTWKGREVEFSRAAQPRPTIGEFARPGTDLDAGLDDAPSAVEVGVSLPIAIGPLPAPPGRCPAGIRCGPRPPDMASG